MTYQWRSGAHIKADADVAGNMCAELEAKGQLTAKNLLDINRPDDAPLHHCFEWDDSIAAENYRESQARTIISSLVVIRETNEPIRCFFNIQHSTPNYKSINTILQNKDDTEALLEMALRELKIFEAKYRSLSQLANVFAAIHGIADTTESKS